MWRRSSFKDHDETKKALIGFILQELIKFFLLTQEELNVTVLMYFFIEISMDRALILLLYSYKCSYNVELYDPTVIFASRPTLHPTTGLKTYPPCSTSMSPVSCTP